MPFQHPDVNRSWITYELDRQGIITTVLHVEPTNPVQVASDIETALANAISEYIRVHDDIDRAEIVPRNL